MSQRFEGRNLEEALNSAAQQYGVERWQLTYGVLLEKRGFLGGVKRVVIEADINEAAIQRPAVAAAVAVAAAAAPVSSGPPRVERSARGPRGGGAGGGGGARGGGGGRGGRSGGGNRGGDRRERAGRGGGGGGGSRSHRDEETTLQPGDFEQFANVEVPDQGPESADATAVREWIDELAATPAASSTATASCSTPFRS